MKYRVRWLPTAEDELTRICESRSGGRRIPFAPPLGAIYEIRGDEQEVYVVHVWHYRVG